MQLEGADWPPSGGRQTCSRPCAPAARPADQPCWVRYCGSTAPRRARWDHRCCSLGRGPGFFSGGCLEADVAYHADQVLRDGMVRRLVYGHGSPWIDIRLLCGGTLEIALERIDPDDPVVNTLLDLSDRRVPVRWTSDGQGRRAEAACAGDPAVRCWDDGYALRFDPAYRVVIVGGDPFVLAMASLSASAGFDTTIVRPLGPVDPPPLPAVHYRRDRPDAAIAALRTDRWTAVVTATHDEELDDLALIAALRGEVGYVGVLGSARRVAARRERLARVDLPPTRIAALHAPIGVARCGKAPWEVAVSVIADIMQGRTDRATFARARASIAFELDMKCVY